MRLKPHRMETLHYKGQRIDIFVDRNSFKFFGEYLGARVEADTMDGAKAAVRAAMDKLTTLEWKQYMSIDVIDPTFEPHHEASVRLSMERYEIAVTPTGTYRKRRHHDDAPPTQYVHETKAQAEERSAAYRANEGTHASEHDVSGDGVFPYDAPTWEALLLIKASILDARMKLSKIVKDPKRLLSGGGPGKLLLGAGASVVKAKKKR